MARILPARPAVPAGPTNLLCYGDNLAFLKQFDDESVDLIYLDPPFNSQQSYNVLFKETTGAPEAAQIKAFEDTWTWDLAANQALTEIQRSPEVPPPPEKHWTFSLCRYTITLWRVGLRNQVAPNPNFHRLSGRDPCGATVLSTNY